jgi:amidohydrolase
MKFMMNNTQNAGPKNGDGLTSEHGGISMISQKVAELRDEMIRLRREFHRHPELGLEEKWTAHAVAEYLGQLGLDVRTGVGRTGVVGLLSGKGPGKTVLLRADMDALPIQEETDVPYKSQNDGVMHACGHDGHMAILLAVARILSHQREAFSGQIKFVFQPGEEGFAGARLMIEDGVLTDSRVDAAFALHLMNQMPSGLIGVRSGPFLASMDAFTVEIKGKSAHAAMPEGGVDAILMSAQAISALQSLISKEVSPMTPLVVHVGTIQGGSAFNIVAEQVTLEGTVRTLDETLQKSVPERMDRILKGVTAALRGTHKLDYRFVYPPLVNDARATGLVQEVAARVAGEARTAEAPQALGTDDFAFFLKEAPGCYFFVGAGNPEKGLDQPHHNARFDFDEEAMPVGAEMLVRVALTYLGID